MALEGRTALDDDPIADRAPSFPTIKIAHDTINSILIAGNDNRVIVHVDPGLLEALRPAPQPALPIPSPYRGLAAFCEMDADWFFGRATLVKAAHARLLALSKSGAPRILAVLGSSGSGKSSVVRAGLLPELARQPPDEFDAPEVVLLKPGEHPLRRLASVLELLPGGQRKIVEIEARLAQSNANGFDGLHTIAGTLPGGERARLVVVVDQFEELFTTCRDAEQRRIFLQTLAQAASAPDRRVSVVLTLRSDFAAAVQAPEAFARAVRQDPLVVQAMSRQELAEAITEPAKRRDRPWPSALVETLVAQVEGRAGALPLLEFALHALWPDHAKGRLPPERWASQLIEVHLNQHAEALYNLPVPDAAARQRIIRRAFRAMVQIGEGVADTRRVACLSEFVGTGETAEQAQAALAPFADPDARLVTASAEAGEPRYELTHEALIQSWPRLREWLGHVADAKEAASIRDGLRLQRRVAAAAAARRARHGGLWRPPELRDLLAYQAASPFDLSAAEAAFAASSLRAWRWVQAGRAVAVLLALTAVAGAGWAWQDRQARIADQRAATEERQKSESRRLAFNATKEAEAGNGMTAVLLALEAIGGSPGTPSRPFVREAEQALQAALLANREEGLLRHAEPGSAVAALAVSQDGGHLLSGGDDGRLVLWDLPAGKPVAELSRPGEAVTQVAFAPDGSGLVLAVFDNIRSASSVVLWNPAAGSQRQVSGHSRQVREAVFSADGGLVATASADGSAILWQTATGLPLRVFPPQGEAGLLAVSVSADNAHLLTTAEDGRAMLWDTRTGLLIRVLRESGEHVVAAEFGPRGGIAVTVAADGTLRHWDMEAPGGGFMPLRRFLPVGAMTAEVRRVDFNASRSLMVSAHADGTTRLREVETGRPVGLPLPEEEGAVALAAFGAEDRLVATLVRADESVASASAPRPVRLWDVTTGRLIATLRGHAAAIRAIAFRPGADGLVSGAEDGTVRLWDARADRSLARLDGYRPRVRELRPPLPPSQRAAVLGLDDQPFAFTADGGRILAAATGGALLSWMPGGGPAALVLANPSSPVTGIATDPAHGTHVAIGRSDGEVQLWDGTATAMTIGRHGAAVSAIAVSRDGARLLTASLDGTARLWVGENGAPGPVLEGHAGPILAAAISPDGALVATAATDGTARLWRTADGQEVAQFPHFGKDSLPTRVVSAVFDHDGRRLLTAASDGVARLWDTVPGAPTQPVKTFRHEGMLRSAAFDPAGRFILTVCADGAAHLWRASDDRAPLGVLQRESGAPVIAAVFIPAPKEAGDEADARYVVTAAEDGIVEIWAGPVRIAALRGHDGAVTGLGFDPTGRRLLTASADHTLRLWPVLPTGAELVAAARQQTTRSLSAEERKRYFLPSAPNGS